MDESALALAAKAGRHCHPGEGLATAGPAVPRPPKKVKEQPQTMKMPTTQWLPGNRVPSPLHHPNDSEEPGLTKALEESMNMVQPASVKRKYHRL